ncbi:MAG: DUF4411 family protein [Bacteroidaceae bacterium]|nr:DUF4411 family protein [Bacteroidaceae bacterium]
MKYLIDANTFITPYRGYAPMDVAVTLWDKFKDMSNSGTIVLLDRVQQELFINSDALHLWVDANFNVASIETFQTNQQAVAKYATISRWAASQNRSQKALEKFLRPDAADIFWFHTLRLIWLIIPLFPLRCLITTALLNSNCRTFAINLA